MTTLSLEARQLAGVVARRVPGGVARHWAGPMVPDFRGGGRLDRWCTITRAHVLGGVRRGLLPAGNRLLPLRLRLSRTLDGSTGLAERDWN